MNNGRRVKSAAAYNTFCIINRCYNFYFSYYISIIRPLSFYIVKFKPGEKCVPNIYIDLWCDIKQVDIFLEGYIDVYLYSVIIVYYSLDISVKIRFSFFCGSVSNFSIFLLDIILNYYCFVHAMSILLQVQVIIILALLLLCENVCVQDEKLMTRRFVDSGKDL